MPVLLASRLCAAPIELLYCALVIVKLSLVIDP